MSLFWITTDDHDEDWFIVAADHAGATRFHEDAEGYDEGDATAELVCEVPVGAPDIETGWPSDELLIACGATFLPNPTGPRIVRVAGRIFLEGDIAGNVAARQGLLFKN